MSSQRRGEGWNKHWAVVVYSFLADTDPVVEKPKVFEVLKQSNEEDDLVMRAFGFPEGKRSDSRQEVAANHRHEATDVQVVYRELLNIFQPKEGERRGARELHRGKPGEAGEVPCANMESLDEWKQTEFVHPPERYRPLEFRVGIPGGVFSHEGVMDTGENDDIPGTTGEGACEEAGFMIDEMCDDGFDDHRGKPGGQSRGCFRGFGRNASQTPTYFLDLTPNPLHCWN